MEKIKEKIKNIYKRITRKHVMIALSVLAVVFLILAGIFAYQTKQLRKAYEVEQKEDSLVKSTATPTATLKPTETPLPATAEATEKPLAGNDSVGSSSSETDSYTAPTKSKTETSSMGSTSSGMIMPAYTAQPSNYASYKEAYRITLANTDFGSVSYSTYCLYDMNGDGMEELIVKNGESEMESKVNVYSYMNNQVELLGDTYGSFANIYGNTDGGLTIYYRRDGAESIDNVTIEDNSILVSSVVPIAYVDTYTQYETSVELPMYSITDVSPLN